MCDPVSAIVGAAVVGAGASMYSANKQAKAQRAGMAAAERQAEKDRASQTRLWNKANQKVPQLSAMMSANRAAGSGGVGSTMLTGRQGSATSGSMLGKSTLLGA